MPRYKLTIAYDGTDFCGWQKQEPVVFGDGMPLRWQAPPADKIVGTVHHEGEESPRSQLRTVQHVVEQAVREVVRERVNLKGSSRTDSGVHARGQVASFFCQGDEGGGGEGSSEPRVNPSTIDAAPTAPSVHAAHTGHSADAGHATSTSNAAEASSTAPVSPLAPDPSAPPVTRGAGWPLSRGADRLMRALNGRLPDDCMIVGAEAVPDSFDPTRDTLAKGYSYTIHASRERALWDRRYVHQIWEPLDVVAMQQAAACIVGEHDFASFAATGHGRLSTVRTVYTCEVTAIAPDRVRIDVSGNGFLWNMVRIIAGTLANVGKGRTKPGDIPAILAAGDRRAAGPTLPPTGLCLEWIKFGAVNHESN